MFPKFDQWCRPEHSIFRHGQTAVAKRIQIAHDQKQIRGFFDRQKPRARHIDTDGVLEALHGGAHGRLQLDYVHSVLANLEGLRVHYDIHVQGSLVQDPFYSWKIKWTLYKEFYD